MSNERILYAVAFWLLLVTLGHFNYFQYIYNWNNTEDDDMSLTVNALSYAQDTQVTPDVQKYTGPAHSMSSLDTMTLKRSAPKPTSDHSGYAKAEAKLTRGMTDGGTPATGVGNGILSVPISIPVDADRTEAETMINDLATWLLTAEAKSVLLDGVIVK